MEQDKIAGIARKIKENELDLWIACPKKEGDEGFDEWVEKKKKWFKHFDIPLENLFVFEKDGQFLGKICLFIEEKDWNFCTM